MFRFISWKCFVVIYLQIHPNTNKISQFWSVCLWFSRKTNVKHNLFGYWKTKERIWYDSKSPVFPHLFICLARVISLSEHLPGSIFSREGDIASPQNLLISFKPIICKLNYSHVIITLHYLWNLSWLLVKFQTLRRTHINISLTMKSNLNSGKD